LDRTATPIAIFDYFRFLFTTPNQGVYSGGGSVTTSEQSSREMRPLALVVRSQSPIPDSSRSTNEIAFE
jgi:hypothetical protein